MQVLEIESMQGLIYKERGKLNKAKVYLVFTCNEGGGVKLNLKILLTKLEMK